MIKMQKIVGLVLATIAFLSAQEIELSGEVLKVEEIADDESDINIAEMHLRIQEREMVKMQLGPTWMMNTDVAPGERTTVRGKYIDETHFMVREMVCNNIRYQLRGENYEPLWLRTRLREQNQIYNPQHETRLKGKVAELYVDEPSAMMEAMVNTNNGQLVRVRLAPEWYLRKQLRIGDELELRGSAVTDNDEMMIMAREMRNMRTNLEIALRNKQGFPDWCGKDNRGEKQQSKPRRNDEHIGRGSGHGN